MNRRIAFVAAILVLALVLVPVAFADKGGNGDGKGGGGKSGTASSSTTTSNSMTAGCVQNTPSVTVDNNWTWGSPGSWGLPGQKLDYEIRVTNSDAGCSSSSFAISVSAPSGFAIAVPTSTITLKSTSSGYLWAYVTSPIGIADGSYPLTVTVQRAGTLSSATASTTSYYRLYSSDSVAPTLFWENPWDGAVLSGRSYNVTVSSSDDHAVKKIDLYIDGNYVSTKACDDVTYSSQLYYTWSIRRVHGQHTVTFRSTDWLGNVGVLTTSFTVN